MAAAIGLAGGFDPGIGANGLRPPCGCRAFGRHFIAHRACTDLHPHWRRRSGGRHAAAQGVLRTDTTRHLRPACGACPPTQLGPRSWPARWPGAWLAWSQARWAALNFRVQGGVFTILIVMIMFKAVQWCSDQNDERLFIQRTPWPLPPDIPVPHRLLLPQVRPSPVHRASRPGPWLSVLERFKRATPWYRPAAKCRKR